MEILAIIPARGGSKGLPGKNIKDLCGKPMIVHTLEAAMSVSAISRVVISTEDEEIAQVIRTYGGEIPFMRPMDLAKDDTPGIAPVMYTLQRLKEEEGYEPDAVMLLQPTSPLRSIVHLEEAIQSFQNQLKDFDSLISVTELEHPVFWNRIIGQEGVLERILEYDSHKNATRQSFQKVFRLNGAIYLIKTSQLIQEQSFETKRTMPFVMDRISSVDIDTLEDFLLAEYYMNKKK